MSWDELLPNASELMGKATCNEVYISDREVNLTYLPYTSCLIYGRWWIFSLFLPEIVIFGLKCFI